MSLPILFEWILIADMTRVNKQKKCRTVEHKHNDFCYTDRFGRSLCSRFDRHLLDGVENVLTTYELAEHGMFFVKMGCWSEREIPLRAARYRYVRWIRGTLNLPISSGSFIGHGEDASAVVCCSTLEVILVSKWLTPVRFTPCTRACRVSCLNLEESMR